MTLENKLGITNEAELARKEEEISKRKALQLFESGDLDRMQSGTFSSLTAIHKYLFEDIYGFAGIVRTVNIAKARLEALSMDEWQASINRYKSEKTSNSHKDVKIRNNEIDR